MFSNGLSYRLAQFDVVHTKSALDGLIYLIAELRILAVRPVAACTRSGSIGTPHSPRTALLAGLV